ncbi:hypothetical protein ACGFX2_10520 [Streptomyces goshikiensis]|uniref:hypothetical protein n=1 Tax=Streptomyces goshikiensis TaxID=1942 RepID=UPI00371A689A
MRGMEWLPGTVFAWAAGRRVDGADGRQPPGRRIHRDPYLRGVGPEERAGGRPLSVREQPDDGLVGVSARTRDGYPYGHLGPPPGVFDAMVIRPPVR